LPPAELVVHPAEENDVHEFYLMCDDVRRFGAQMEKHRIAKPAREVFETIVDPVKMSCCFTSWGSGCLDAGRAVTRKWADAGTELTITPGTIHRDRSITFEWSASGTESAEVIDLEPDGVTATVVRVSESSWPLGALRAGRCIEQTQGWTHMLCCLKAYMEPGIDLRRSGVAGRPAN
jgi:uncharacterized protein YndB with AHSA1/START domain